MEVIAHRGASGYLPEHTLPAKALAHAMGADYLEQDVVSSSDGHLLVLHDIHIDRVSDAADRFPQRAREDGRYYAVDFTLEELRKLALRERRDANGQPVYPGRYAENGPAFRVHTLDEEIRFINGLNGSTGRNVGLYTEIKKPAWHREHGIDLSAAVIDSLAQGGYTHATDNVWLQCFDADENRRIREELDCSLRLVQLVAENDWQETCTDYDALKTEEGVRGLAKNVDAVGPWIQQLYRLDANGLPVLSDFACRLRDSALDCHPYTLRSDDLPPGFNSVQDVIHFMKTELGASAVFADQPDLARHAIIGL
ncbi:MAG: glycerophosphodiester phosphodiesterase [Pseudomonadota bacterium]